MKESASYVDYTHNTAFLYRKIMES